jgi:hypothetical protein
MARQAAHTSAYVNICPHTSAYASKRENRHLVWHAKLRIRQHTSTYVRICQHTPAHVRKGVWYGTPSCAYTSSGVSLCTVVPSKASKLSSKSEKTHLVWHAKQVTQLRCQFVYFCSSKASNLSSKLSKTCADTSSARSMPDTYATSKARALLVAYAYGIERAEDVSVQVLLSLLALLVQKYVLY